MSQPHTFTSPESLQEFASQFAKKLPGGSVVVLSGDLGAGKTTFVKGLARGLGIKNHITSPTFLVMRTYPVPGKKCTLYHADAYRLGGAQELLDIGFDEILGHKQSIVVVEWGEKFPELLPKNTKHLHFKIVNRTTRTLTIR